MEKAKSEEISPVSTCGDATHAGDRVGKKQFHLPFKIPIAFFSTVVITVA